MFSPFLPFFADFLRFYRFSGTVIFFFSNTIQVVILIQLSWNFGRLFSTNMGMFSTNIYWIGVLFYILGHFEKKKNRPRENSKKWPHGVWKNPCISAKNILFAYNLVQYIHIVYRNHIWKFELKKTKWLGFIVFENNKIV